jgi:hypothetical protein
LPDIKTDKQDNHYKGHVSQLQARAHYTTLGHFMNFGAGNDRQGRF